MKTTTSGDWVPDENGNRANIKWCGSEAAAIAQLATLSDCGGCSDCSGMSPQKISSPIPVIPDIHKAIFAAVSRPNALDMATWHTCETTHFRAGWVVTLAGEPGKALESETSTLFAAQQIYKASGCEISPVRFFDDNEKAMADMKRLAESV